MIKNQIFTYFNSTKHIFNNAITLTISKNFFKVFFFVNLKPIHYGKLNCHQLIVPATIIWNIYACWSVCVCVSNKSNLDHRCWGKTEMFLLYGRNQLNKKYILKIVILCKLRAFQWQKGTWSPICISLSPLFFSTSIFFTFCKRGIHSTEHQIPTKGCLVRKLYWLPLDVVGQRQEVQKGCELMKSHPVLHFDVLRNAMPRVVALNCKGLVSTSETKAVIAIQWQHELLHVQPNPISLAWERNAIWQVIPWLFLFILSSVLIIQDIW